MLILRRPSRYTFAFRLSLRLLPGVACLLSLSVLSGCLSHSLTGITIQPSTGNTIVIPGVSAQFTAIGIYTEGGHAPVTKDITSLVTWSTVIPAVATVNSSGLATGVAPGTTSILASIPGEFGNLTATSNIVVNAPSSSGGSGPAARTLTSVTVIPGNQTLNVTGQSAQLIAMGSYTASPTSANLSTQVSWVSSDNSVAQVNRTGLVTAMGTGTATISALATGPDGSQLSGSATISVTSGQTARTLTALNITPGSQTLTLNEAANLVAIGTYNTSPVSADLTKSAAWISSDNGIATVNNAGVVTAVGAGNATITAEATAADGSVVSASATLTVTANSTGSSQIPTSLSVIPVSQSVTAVGETGQFLAIGTYSSGGVPTADLTYKVKWLSSDVGVATIDADGLATATGPGETTITAEFLASDGTAITASATFQSATGGPPTPPTLTVYGAGRGSGTVTGSDPTVPDAITCSYIGSQPSPGNGPGSGCTGTFTVGTVVTLTAAPASGSVFDGWSNNCAPVAGNPNQCTITVNNNTSVGAIFDPK